MDTPQPPTAGHSAQDPEEYIRDLERRAISDLERQLDQTPKAAPQPAGTDAGPPSGMAFSAPPAPRSSEQSDDAVPAETLPRWFGGVAKLLGTPRRRLLLVCVAAFAVPIMLFMSQYASKTTVHGHLIMINSGAKDTIDCNNGNLKLDGDNNTYTITGHCLRLEVFGSANHVTLDSADTISTIGDDNAITYRSGSPTINKTGSNNTVVQRLSTR